jgi:O-acetyl-ADP-ribose deacetylase (regulator of RNase III)
MSESITVGSASIEIVQGDITTQTTDAIVNAANASLLGGGGVDGAIHRAGGPQILAECKKVGGCETGNAKITTGGNLPARFVIHAVGPIYQGGKNREDKLLASCYLKSLKLAEENNLSSISFPSISTGAYRYPVEEAAHIAMQTVHNYLQNSNIQIVRFVLFDEHTFQTYKNAVKPLQ